MSKKKSHNGKGKFGPFESRSWKSEKQGGFKKFKGKSSCFPNSGNKNAFKKFRKK